MATRTLLVLAGGLGTRLRSVVADVPKPLAPVDGHPFLHHAIENWRRQGIDKLMLLLQHRAEAIEKFVAEHRELMAGLEVCISIEPQPLGTGGAVAHAVKAFGLSGSFLVTNADTWLGSGVTELAGARVPAMGIVRVDNVERYGCVRVDGGRIAAFSEKGCETGAGWINAGIYHLDAAVFDRWDGRPFSLEKELFPVLAAAGSLHGVALDTDFIDIGIPEDYARFCRWIASGKTEDL